MISLRIIFILFLSLNFAHIAYCKNVTKSLVKEFHQARNKGNLMKLCKVLKEMKKENIIKIDMPVKQIIKILGPADSGTGIYGHYASMGYGNPKNLCDREFIEGVRMRCGDNYDKFVWLHFDQKNSAGNDNSLLFKEWSCE